MGRPARSTTVTETLKPSSLHLSIAALAIVCAMPREIFLSVTKPCKCAGERACDQELQADVSEQARGDPRSKGFSHEGDHGAACPERVAAGRVRCVRKSIEHEVGERVAGEMLGKRPHRSEDETLRRNAMADRLLAQILGRPPILFEQPEHAVGYAV